MRHALPAALRRGLARCPCACWAGDLRWSQRQWGDHARGSYEPADSFSPAGAQPSPNTTREIASFARWSRPTSTRFGSGGDFRTLGAFYEDYPLIATFPLQTGQSRAHRPDKALGGLWESSVPIAVGVPRGAIGSWPMPDRLARPAGPKRGTIEAEEFSPALGDGCRQGGQALRVPTERLPH